MLKFIATILSLALATSLAAADWPGWRGPQRDGYVPPGVPMPSTLPATPKILWRTPITDGFASVAVANGKLFFFDLQNGKETLHAVDAASGKELWQEPIDTPHKDGFGTGARCTPLTDGDKVYAQSCKGELHCRAAADGKLIWRKNYSADFGATFIGEIGQAQGGSRHGNTGSPLIDGEHLIAVAGGKGASVVCLEKGTGDVVWKAEDDTAGYAPPIVATLAGVKQYVVFTAIGLIGLNAPDGKLLWRVPYKTMFGRHVTTPVVSDDTVIVASHRIGLVGVKISKDGDVLKAEQIWENKEAAVNFSSPVVVGGHVYGVGQASKVFCADVKTGVMTWGEMGVVTSAVDRAYASFLVMDKTILILNDSGELILIDANEKEYKPRSRIKVCDFNWCNPAYVDGKLFVRDGKEVQCIELTQ